MVLQIHSEPEKEMNWSTVSEFVDKKRMSRISPPCTYFVQECKPYGVNWVLCFLWAGIRTQFWSARCWIERNDCCNLGGNYQSIRESVRDCAKEFDKFTSTDMLIEQQQIEKDYSECMAFAKNENPQSKDPVIDPPKPTPLPDPKPEPDTLPKPDPVPGKGFNWKVLVPLAVGLLTLLTGLLPPPWNFLVKLIVSALGGILD